MALNLLVLPTLALRYGRFEAAELTDSAEPSPFHGYYSNPGE